MRAVITFHSIDDQEDILSCSPDAFGKILLALQSKNIPVHDLDTLLSKPNISGVALTFDDGMKSVINHALPILIQFNAASHVFLTTSLIGQYSNWPSSDLGVGSYKMLDWNDVEVLQNNKVRFESHTHTHPDLQQISLENLHRECDEADTIIHSRTGRVPKFFAYPFGKHNKKTRGLVRERYQAAFSTELAYLTNNNQDTLPRLDSYYLRNDLVLQNIDNVLGRLYFRTRSLMRTAKGSQTPPNAK